MKLAFSSVVILAACLGHITLALPQALPSPEMVCAEGLKQAALEYSDIVEDKYDGAAELVTGASCTTTANERCSIAKQYTWTK